MTPSSREDQSSRSSSIPTVQIRRLDEAHVVRQIRVQTQQVCREILVVLHHDGIPHFDILGVGVGVGVDERK